MTGFSDTQIVSMLGQHSLWSRRACREILKRPADFIPRLLGVMDSAISAGEDFDDDGILIPSSLLLAQMGEKQAYPRLAALITYDDETIDQIWGDMISESVPAQLRDTFNGDHTLLPQLIENKTASIWSRITALNAWGLHYLDGHISRDEITGFFRRLLEEAPKKIPKDEQTFFGFLASAINDRQLKELIDPVVALYNRNGIDRAICGSCERYLRDFDNPLSRPEDRHITDTIKELETWRWFEANYESHDDDDEYDEFE